jgi:hypothetical protein
MDKYVKQFINIENLHIYNLKYMIKILNNLYIQNIIDNEITKNPEINIIVRYYLTENKIKEIQEKINQYIINKFENEINLNINIYEVIDDIKQIINTYFISNHSKFSIYMLVILPYMNKIIDQIKEEVNSIFSKKYTADLYQDIVLIYNENDNITGYSKLFTNIVNKFPENKLKNMLKNYPIVIENSESVLLSKIFIFNIIKYPY